MLASIKSQAADNQPKSAVDDHLALLRVPQEIRQLIIDDPTLPLRTIRDLGNIADPNDRLYLAGEVRAGNLSSNGLTKVLQQSKKSQKEQVSAASASPMSSAYADEGESVPLTSETKKSSDIPQSTPPAPKRRAVSPVVALAALEQKLSRDESTLRKVMERLKEDIAEMTHEEKACVSTHVNQWRIWIEDILDLTKQTDPS